MMSISSAKALLGLPDNDQGEVVILLHGLGRSAASFAIMEWRLKWEGYQVININYPSTAASIRELADVAIATGLAEAEGRRVHFVTHSMGGILVRQYLAQKTIQNLGHTVMLGPPNQGSPIIDDWIDVPGFDIINGVAGYELGTAPDSIPNQLGPVNYPVGVIAGSNSINPIFGLSFEGPNDGKVSVESTKVQGMTDHLILPVTHTFMMNDQTVFKQVLAFLQDAKFDHNLLVETPEGE